MFRASIVAVIFLVLLRLAIGWHFLVEGWHKIESERMGETLTNRPFSSAGYFREATGPLAGPMRLAMGDPDAEALARLVVQPLPPGEPSREPPRLRVPPALARDWKNYLTRFEEHYGLNDQQRAEAGGKVEQSEDGVVLWLLQEEPDENTPELKRSYPSGDVLRRVPTAERVQLYQNKLNEVRDMLGRKMWLFGRDVEKARVRQAKVEATQLRTELVRDLDRHTQSLMRSLNLVAAQPVLTPLEYLDNDLIRGNDLLTSAPKQGEPNKALEAVVFGLKGVNDTARDLTPLTPEQVGTPGVTAIDTAALRKRLQEQSASLTKQAEELKTTAASDEVKKYAEDVEADAKALGSAAKELPDIGPLVIPRESNQFVRRLDLATMYGLAIVGGCLLVGLFARINAWLAAGFLLMTYLAMPAFPWLPSPPQTEGNYLFVNKNVIEMLALCVLGSMPTGRWFGLDAVLHWLVSAITGKRS
jgi:uncharacterized membrane protein YphA (DoxX/SURF4 family)